MAEKAENIKHVVTVVSQSEGVDDCIEADRQQCASDEETENEDARE